MARCMLVQSGLPMTLWAEAINTAAFLRNRCPTKALEGRTPLEEWIGTKPDVSFLRMFGCKAFALQKGPGVTKLDPKGHEFVMVGYDSESKAYRLWERGTRRIIKSRDVRFIEDMDSKNERDVELVEMQKPHVAEGVMADEHSFEIRAKVEPSQQPTDSVSKDWKEPAAVEEEDGAWSMASEVTPKKAVEPVQRPVSYTHLDVYKRQGLERACSCRGGRWCLEHGVGSYAKEGCGASTAIRSRKGKAET
ncbi:hypothetical protein DBV15_10944 [Temnothorax longispinosus]|uniref:Retroviral polymerase SH3-like domain-containing protein n=1 Tax=Temnothorax longispinosus TaxID=300112 RepID=A0A4S2KBJ4_9HYME|nr:hypothetical protein DBV15_10944 [Temnothorax longispinosus]